MRDFIAIFVIMTLAYCASASAGGNHHGHHDHSSKVTLKSDSDKFWKGIVLGAVVVGVTCHFSEGCRFFAGDPEKKPEPEKGIELRQPGTLQ